MILEFINIYNFSKIFDLLSEIFKYLKDFLFESLLILKNWGFKQLLTFWNVYQKIFEDYDLLGARARLHFSGQSLITWSEVELNCW